MIKLSDFDVPLFKLFLKDFLNPSTYVMVASASIMTKINVIGGFLLCNIVFTLFWFFESMSKVGLDVTKK